MSDTTVNMPTSNPSRKVVGATGGALIGTATANLLLWGLDDYVFDPDVASSVPGPVEAFIMLVVPTALTFIGGYFTKRAASEVPAAGPNEELR